MGKNEQEMRTAPSLEASSASSLFFFCFFSYPLFRLKFTTLVCRPARLHPHLVASIPSRILVLLQGEIYEGACCLSLHGEGLQITLNVVTSVQACCELACAVVNFCGSGNKLARALLANA